MARGRVSLRVAREILRLKFEARLRNPSRRQIGRACGVSCSTVSEAVGRFQAADLSWPLPADSRRARPAAAPQPRRPQRGVVRKGKIRIR